MDLHIVGAEPTAEERAAVDALLGPPESGWAGGRRDSAQTAVCPVAGLGGGRDRRDLLLPALHAVQDRVGWVSRGALNYICRRLIVPPAEAWGVVTFYHLFATAPHAAGPWPTCATTSPAGLNGADEICAARLRHLTKSRRGMRSPCLGQCDRAPAALIIRAGEAPSTRAVGASLSSGA